MGGYHDRYKDLHPRNERQRRTVRGYGDGSDNLEYTINGEAKSHISQGDQTYVYTGEAGFINLIVTHGRYISYIKGQYS